MFKENINDKPESKSSVTSQDSGLSLESYGPLPSTPQITFRESECAYIVQIDDLSTPEYQEGVPSLRVPNRQSSPE